MCRLGFNSPYDDRMSLTSDQVLDYSVCTHVYEYSVIHSVRTVYTVYSSDFTILDSVHMIVYSVKE